MRQQGGDVMNINELTVKLFADGANISDIKMLAAKPYIKGFTTNPTLMRQAGVENYTSFAGDLLNVVSDRPVSFEVFADDFDEMEMQALEIAAWGDNINVKIPVTNTHGESSAPLIARLSKAGVAVNVTAVFTLDQVREITAALATQTPAIVSIFAGRIADTGADPMPIMAEAIKILKSKPKAELLWASPREVLNVYQANQIGCHIITATPDILKKLALAGKDHGDYSLETVKMFYDDAASAKYTIEFPPRLALAGQHG